MVFGSGRTWPHDFLFLTGFFSVVSEVVGTVASGVAAGVEAGTAGVETRSVEAGGVMILSTGFIVGDVSNRDGYISPGVDKKDSAGDVSNLTEGVDMGGTWLLSEAISPWLDWTSMVS